MLQCFQQAGFGRINQASGPTDPNYAFRTLILNFTATGQTDQSSYHDPFVQIVPNVTGAPTFDSSLGIQLNGSTQYVDTEDAARWQFGSDFGIELKGVIATAVNRTQYLVCQRTGGHPIWVLLIKNPGAIEFFSSLGDGTVVTQISSSSSVISAGVSFDLAIKRASGTCSMWLNQSSVTISGTNSSTAYPNSTDRLALFTQSGDTTVRFGGSVKGVRLTNGYSPDMSTMSYPFPTS
jgi:hypothetical protein